MAEESNTDTEEYRRVAMCNASRSELLGEIEANHHHTTITTITRSNSDREVAEN